MKKIITISTLLIFFVIAVFTGYSYFASFSNVKFTFAKDVEEIKIYIDSNDESGDTLVATLQSSGEVRVSNGNYYIAPSGNNIITDKISIKISGNTLVDIDPNYSSKYLSSLVDSESNAIINVINKSLSPTIESYDIEQIKLYGKANWAGALLVPKDVDTQNPSGIHRVVLKNETGSWQVVGSPQIVMTMYNTGDVPLDILKSVNDLVF